MAKIFKKITFFLGGSIFADKDFVRNIPFLIAFFVIGIMYIANRYTCIEYQKEIANLEQKLKEAKFESLTTSAKLMGNSRETKVEEMIKKSGVNIEINNKPIYRVK